MARHRPDPAMTNHTPTPPLPPATVAGDAARARALRSMKRFATGLLVAMAVVFVVTRAAEDGGVLGYARAFAEAAMIGALADWFAVTALFRHPLGLPIPHTAIIPTRKDEIGRGLGEFVQHNFLSGPVLSEKLASVGVADRLGRWLRDPANAATVGARVGDLVRAATDALDHDEVGEAVAAAVTGRIRAVPAAPLAAEVLEVAVAGGHHQAALDAVLAGSAALLEHNQDELRARLDSESPWWVPDAVDDRIFAKVYAGVSHFLVEVGENPDHHVRRQFDERVRALVDDLRRSPELAAKAEGLKAQVLDHPSVQAWAATLWGDARHALVEATADETSELRRHLEAAVVRLGETLVADADLRRKLDTWVEQTVVDLLHQYRAEVADLVAGTVARWDANDASRRIELQVGRDLQYIRINGTVVGGLAGLALHAIGELAF